MKNIITAPKIGTGNEGDHFRPDATPPWQIVDERETEFDIEILSNNPQ